MAWNRGVAKMPEGNRKADKELKTGVKIAMYIDPETARQLKRLAEAADMKLSKAVGKLVAYAIDKLGQEKRRKEANRW